MFLSVCYVSGTVQSTWHVLTVSTHRTVLWQKVLLLLGPLLLRMSNQSTKVGGDALDFLGCFSTVFRAPSPPPVQPVGFHKLPRPVTPSWVQSNRKPQLETSGKKTGPAPFPAESWNWLHPSTFVLKAQPRASLGKEGHSRLLPRRTVCHSSGGFGEEMATHSSILAWKIPCMEEPGRLQSIRSQRFRHDWAISLSLYIHLFKGGVADKVRLFTGPALFNLALGGVGVGCLWSSVLSGSLQPYGL